MGKFWAKLNVRERMLAVGVAALSAIWLLYAIIGGAIQRINDLDRAIDRLEFNRISYARQILIKDKVEAAFSRVASQHSSEWTEQEIQDRLREEIYRLALRNPPPPGVPVKGSGVDVSQYIVGIPQLREGRLDEGGEGYREYQLSIRIPSTTISGLAIFLRRLHESAQALRIDSFELSRAPANDTVAATIDVTRTIVDSLPEELLNTITVTPVADAVDEGPLVNGGFEAWEEGSGSPVGWDVQDCATERSTGNVTERLACLEAEASADMASISQRLLLDTGGTYDLYLDVKAAAPVRLSVMDAASNSPLGDGQDVVADGEHYRYHLRFSVPGDGSNLKHEVLAPYIAIMKAGAKVYVDNVVIAKGGE